MTTAAASNRPRTIWIGLMPSSAILIRRKPDPQSTARAPRRAILALLMAMPPAGLLVAQQDSAHGSLEPRKRPGTGASGPGRARRLARWCFPPCAGRQGQESHGVMPHQPALAVR